MVVCARRRVLLASFLLAGCSAGDSRVYGFDRVFASPALPSVRITPAPDLARAIDPHLEGFSKWMIAYDVSPMSPGTTCEVVILRDGHEVARLDGSVSANRCSAEWDGRIASGAVVTAGPLTLELHARVPGRNESRVDLEAEVVRLGARTIDITTVEPNGTVPLLYARAGGERDSFWALPAGTPAIAMGVDAREPSGATINERADGTPRRFPERWTDLGTPPLDERSRDGVERDSYNLPVGIVAGSRVRAAIEWNADTDRREAAGDPSRVEVRAIAPDGFAFEAGSMFRHAEKVALVSAASPAPGVGRYDLDWMIRFEARVGPGEWTRIPGEIRVPARLYGFVGQPSLALTTMPYRAWLEVVDRVAGWVDGATRNPSDVAARIVHGVYYEENLRYERRGGASAYTDYVRGDYRNSVFYLSAYLDREYGRTINCSDAASIVSTFAQMIGVDLRYHIMTNRRPQQGFDLNYIQAIGWPGFTERPFASGAGEFSYHAATHLPSGEWFDATLALDGDADPRSAPSTLLLPAAIDAERYLVALSSESAMILSQYDQKARLR